MHEIDAARWLLGDFDEVHASAGRFSALEIETEDTAGALLSRQGGPVVHIGLDYVSRKPVREYRLIGERASAVWDLPGQELRLELPSDTQVITAGIEDFDVSQTYLSAMRKLLEAIQTGGRTRYELDEAMKTTDLMLTIQEKASM